MRTASGFEFEIDKNALDDMELVEALAELENNPTAIPKILRILLGPEQKAALYEHCRDGSGRVPATRVGAELAEMFRLATDSLKKS